MTHSEQQATQLFKALSTQQGRPLPEDFATAVEIFSQFDLKARGKPPFHAAHRKIKQIIYALTLAYNRFWHKRNPGQWWSEIIPHLYLGAIPLQQQAEELFKLDLGLVISLLESHEHEESIVARPMRRDLWEGCAVGFLSLATLDFYPVTIADLYKGALAINEEQILGKGTYVHCKAGKSRSAAVVVAYLATFGGMSLEDAEALVKKQRPIISLGNKRTQIRMFAQLYAVFYGNSEAERDLALADCLKILGLPRFRK